jgi:hypothetical protein
MIFVSQSHLPMNNHIMKAIKSNQECDNVKVIYELKSAIVDH